MGNEKWKQDNSRSTAGERSKGEFWSESGWAIADKELGVRRVVVGRLRERKKITLYRGKAGKRVPVGTSKGRRVSMNVDSDRIQAAEKKRNKNRRSQRVNGAGTSGLQATKRDEQ